MPDYLMVVLRFRIPLHFGSCLSEQGRRWWPWIAIAEPSSLWSNWQLHSRIKGDAVELDGTKDGKRKFDID